jgi:hypothetical protein
MGKEQAKSRQRAGREQAESAGKEHTFASRIVVVIQETFSSPYAVWRGTAPLPGRSGQGPRRRFIASSLQACGCGTSARLCCCAIIDYCNVIIDVRVLEIS